MSGRATLGISLIADTQGLRYFFWVNSDDQAKKYLRIGGITFFPDHEDIHEKQDVCCMHSFAFRL